MMVMFQYRGKAYSFTMPDEVLLDIEYAIKGIEEGRCPAMPMTPGELTQYFRERKKNPANYTDEPEAPGAPN